MTLTITDGIVLITTLAVLAMLALPQLSRASLWRAAVTPLASIIGSGFLVLGPILALAYGAWAPLTMFALCMAAYAIGGALRFNIARIDQGRRTATEDRLETLSAWLLAFAYVISVTYYLNLFGAFALELTPIDQEWARRVLTSVVFAAICLTGWTKGFRALERLEQGAVSLKLAVIGGLLVGMALFFGAKLGQGALIASPPDLTGWPALTLAFGLIVTVQGFETSRYLGQEYDAPTRIRAMRLAQMLSTAIYIGYILLLTYAFAPQTIPATETGIIAMMRQVAPVLPGLLILAALTAQFSAAVADTGGAGGLIQGTSRQRISDRAGYVILSGLGITLTWIADVYDIIAYASRAFALYYAVQCAIAARGAWAQQNRRAIWFAALAIAALVMALFGTPAEGT